jgi:hypothetical protein
VVCNRRSPPLRSTLSGAPRPHQMAIGRLQTLIADCALDGRRRAPHPNGLGRDAIRHDRSTRHSRGTTLARQTGDTPGGGTAMLARVRENDCMDGKPTDDHHRVCPQARQQATD